MGPAGSGLVLVNRDSDGPWGSYSGFPIGKIRLCENKKYILCKLHRPFQRSPAEDQRQEEFASCGYHFLECQTP